MMGLLSFSALFSLAALAAAPLPTHLQQLEAVGLSRLEQSADWRVRQQAAAIRAWEADPDGAALAWMAEPRLTRAGFPRLNEPSLHDPLYAPILLERLLQKGEEEAVRMAIVELLPRVGGDWAEALAARYPEEPQPGVRLLMVEVARHAPADIGRTLVRLGAQDPAPTVRAAAMRAVPAIQDGSGLTDLLLGGLSDGDSDVRAYAARGAGWLALSDAWQPLDLLLEDADPLVRLHALRALERLDAPRAARLPRMVALTHDPDTRVAHAAAQVQNP